MMYLICWKGQDVKHSPVFDQVVAEQVCVAIKRKKKKL